MFSKHFLLVEDDIDDQVIFTEVLHDVTPDCVCDIVNDGQEALEYLSYSTPDMIITDVNMPKIDGLELIKIIKRKLKIPVPVVVWSTKLPDRGIIDDLEIVGSFSKPFDIKHLYAFMEKIVSISASC